MRNHALFISAGIVAIRLLLPAPALAGVNVLSAGGTIGELAQVGDCPDVRCVTRCRETGGGQVDAVSAPMTFTAPDCMFRVTVALRTRQEESPA